MELWIRSQDKKAMVKIESIFVENKYTQKKVRKLYMPDYATSYGDIEETCDYEDDEYIKTIIYNNNAILGEYSSEKRALEVLDEIQKILKPRCTVDTSSINFDGKPYEQKGVILQDCNANVRIEEFSTFVYEMPKE